LIVERKGTTVLCPICHLREVCKFLGVKATRTDRSDSQYLAEKVPHYNERPFQGKKKAPF